MSVLLRIIQQAVEESFCMVSVVCQSPTLVEETTAKVPLLTPEDEEGLRWYLEEYLKFPADPAPVMARKVEQRMQEMGFALFTSIFKSNGKGSQIWQQMGNLSEVDFQITVSPDAIIPWELMQNPLDLFPIACLANSFIRVVDTNTSTPQFTAQQDLIRILLVISRPKGDSDAPFRSVAARLLQILGNHPAIKIEVLRPATFEALEHRLQDALFAGHPFKILHFDGHGTFGYPMENHGIASRKRGYLIFENASNSSVKDPVDGNRIGTALVENKVPIVILNACRSARSESGAEPTSKRLKSSSRSYGSLADELIKSGVVAVVAMQYNIFVPTAAHFVATFYTHLAAGKTLPAALNVARRYLFENADRRVAAGTLKLQDWIVPVLYQTEAAEMNHFKIPDLAAIEVSNLSNLPPQPATGFVGRDNILLQLDRLFQSYSIVLLWGMMGSGKTTTASEFGKWLLQTGGGIGRILFTSFREYKSLRGIINDAASVLQEELKEKGIEWLTLPETKRLPVLLDVICMKPCLWIWDNFENVSPKNEGSSPWTEEEIDQIGDFLQKIKAIKVKVLFTSRIKSLPWTIQDLQELELPGMEQEERVDLVMSLLQDPQNFQLETWQELLHFSQGNPLVLSLLTRQVLLHGYSNATAINGFLEMMRSDEGEDLQEYSIRQAILNEFNAEEQKLLSICWLFEGVVDVRIADMVSQGMLEIQKVAVRSEHLLDRIVQLGLAVPAGSRYYNFHPGLPPFLKNIFLICYPADEAERMQQRFALIFSLAAQSLYNHFESGMLDSADISIHTLKIHEASLRRALYLALQHNDRISGLGLLLGIFILYKHFGRWTEFSRLMDEVLPRYVDVQTNKALPGLEELWADIQHLRVELLLQSRRLSDAAQLQQDIIHEKRNVDNRNNSNGDSPQSNVIKGIPLASHLFKLAGIQKEQGLEACLFTYNEALEIAQRGGNTNLESDIAFELAKVYMDQDFLNLDEAEYWLNYALEATTKVDRIRYGNIRSQMAKHALMLFEVMPPDSDLRRDKLENVIENLKEALQIIPLDRVEMRIACFTALGQAHALKGNQQNHSVFILQEAISLAESVGDAFAVGENQLKLAKVLRSAGDNAKALLFADAALRSFASLAPEAEDELLEVLAFVDGVEMNQLS